MANPLSTLALEEVMSGDAAPRITRRTFLRGALASVATLAVGRAAGPALLGPKGPGGGGGGTTTRNLLRIPPVLSHNGTTLEAAPSSVNIGGMTSNVLGYNGQFPGPTFVANRGDAVAITLLNKLAQATTIHWHGMIVPTEADGHPRDVVAPGADHLYRYMIDQRAALNWYHPHPHMHTGHQVYQGLAGAFIVRDAEELALGLPSGAYEVPLILRDVSFDSSGTFTFKTSASGFFGREPLVNGTRSPYRTVDKGWYRFRVLNGCNARVMRLALGNNGNFTLIGNDGGLLRERVLINQITIGPGERLDLLVDFSGLGVNAKVMLRDLDSGWDLLEFRGSGNPGYDYNVPTTLSHIDTLSGPATPTRTFTFDGMTKINGRTYSMNRIDFEIPLNAVERWRFITNGNGPHPVHVHGASYQVQARSGGRGTLFPWEGGWKDTVLVSDGETVDVLIRFDIATGNETPYLIHCHQLGHEDNGMMANFHVG